MAALSPSVIEPWTWFSAPLRFTIWEPTSTEATTRSTVRSPAFVTVTSATSAM